MKFHTSIVLSILYVIVDKEKPNELIWTSYHDFSFSTSPNTLISLRVGCDLLIYITPIAYCYILILMHRIFLYMQIHIQKTKMETWNFPPQPYWVIWMNYVEKENSWYWALVAHIYNPSDLKLEGLRLEASLGKKFTRPPSQPISGCGNMHLSSQQQWGK
jgi:hypothetical protein